MVRTLSLMLIACVFATAAYGADERPPDVTKPPAADEFMIIPLRIHVLSGDPEEIDCKLTDADLDRIVGKINRVWSVAGIHFGVESVVREPAARQALFSKWKDEFGGSVPLHFHRALLPDASRKFDGLHVYYVHKLPVNGVYMGEDFAIVQETAKLREVPGGIDEPLPRVTSHELGHALGLQHRQNETNLMASGTTGILLNEPEVKTARERALKVKGAMTYEQCRAAAKASGDPCDGSRAERLARWLEGVEKVARAPRP